MSLTIRKRVPTPPAIRAFSTGARRSARDTPERLSHWLQSLASIRQSSSPPRTSSASSPAKPQSPSCTISPTKPPSPRTPPLNVPTTWRKPFHERCHRRLTRREPAPEAPRPSPIPVASAPQAPETQQVELSALQRLLRKPRQPRFRPIVMTPEMEATQCDLRQREKERAGMERMRGAYARIAAWEAEHVKPYPSPAVKPTPSPEPTIDPQSDEDTAQDMTPQDFEDDEPQLRDRSVGRSPDRWCALSPVLSIIPEQTEHSQTTATKSSVGTEVDQSSVPAPSPCEGLSDDGKYRAQFKRVVGDDFADCMQASIAGLSVRDEVTGETSLITGYSSPQMEPLSTSQLLALDPEVSQYSIEEERWIAVDAKRNAAILYDDSRHASWSSPDSDASSTSLDEPLLSKVTLAPRARSPPRPAPSGPGDLFGDILDDIDAERRHLASQPTATAQPDVFADIVLKEEVRLPVMVTTTIWVERPVEQQHTDTLGQIKTKAIAMAKTAWSTIKSFVGR